MIPFVDLRKENRGLAAELQRAFQRVSDSGWYILGQQLSAFEEEFSAYIGSRHAVGVNSGSDALYLSLKALEIGENDEVLTVPLTFMSTVDAITRNGMRPVLVDIEPDSFCMDGKDLEKKINSRTRAVVPVHIFGHPVEMNQVQEVARAYNLHVVEDACQAHGAEYRGRKVGSFGVAGCFSFYPTKNLGAMGDAGMVVTDDGSLASRLKCLRDYGRSETYIQESPGINSRLDEIQAAFLRVKLKHLDLWNERRRQMARLYDEILGGIEEIRVPSIKEGTVPVYHQYAIRVKERNKLQMSLKKKGIQTLIHYPVPVHLQKAYRFLGYQKGDLPASEMCAEEVLSLPIHPGLEEGDVACVASAIREFFIQ